MKNSVRKFYEQPEITLGERECIEKQGTTTTTMTNKGRRTGITKTKIEFDML